jgi:hypothetical protein
MLTMAKWNGTLEIDSELDSRGRLAGGANLAKSSGLNRAVNVTLWNSAKRTLRNT